MFNQAKNQPMLLVLSSCFTEPLAISIIQNTGVQFVIATKKNCRISEKESHLFAREFYAIVYSNSGILSESIIQRAFYSACFKLFNSPECKMILLCNSKVSKVRCQEIMRGNISYGEPGLNDISSPRAFCNFNNVCDWVESTISTYRSGKLYNSRHKALIEIINKIAIAADDTTKYEVVNVSGYYGSGVTTLTLNAMYFMHAHGLFTHTLLMSNISQKCYQVRGEKAANANTALEKLHFLESGILSVIGDYLLDYMLEHQLIPDKSMFPTLHTVVDVIRLLELLTENRQTVLLVLDDVEELIEHSLHLNALANSWKSNIKSLGATGSTITESCYFNEGYLSLSRNIMCMIVDRILTSCNATHSRVCFLVATAVTPLVGPFEWITGKKSLKCTTLNLNDPNRPSVSTCTDRHTTVVTTLPTNEELAQGLIQNSTRKLNMIEMMGNAPEVLNGHHTSQALHALAFKQFCKHPIISRFQGNPATMIKFSKEMANISDINDPSALDMAAKCYTKATSRQMHAFTVHSYSSPVLCTKKRKHFDTSNLYSEEIIIQSTSSPTTVACVESSTLNVYSSDACEGVQKPNPRLFTSRTP